MLYMTAGFDESVAAAMSLVSEQDPSLNPLRRPALPLGAVATGYEDMITGALAGYDQCRADNTAAAERARIRLGQIQSGLETAYQTYAGFRPENVRDTDEATRTYWGLIRDPETVRAAVNQPHDSASGPAAWAANRFYGNRVHTHDDVNLQAFYVKVMARNFLLTNLQLLVNPNAMHGLSPDTLAKYNGITRAELTTPGIDAPRLNHPSLVLAVLASNVLNNTSYDSLIPTSESFDEGKAVHGQELKDQWDREGGALDDILSQPHISARPYNRSDYEHAERKRAKTERDFVERLAGHAVARAFGAERNSPAVTRNIGLLTECLVASLHDFANAPLEIQDVLATRMHLLARSRGSGDGRDLPPAARAVYSAAIRHYNSRSDVIRASRGKFTVVTDLLDGFKF